METQETQSPNARLFAALAKAQQAFKPITRNREVEVKTKSGEKYHFRYATLDAVIDATKDALAANGLAQFAVIGAGKISVTLAHSSGESITSSLPLPDPSVGWHAFGSSVTYARRYLWSPLIGVAAEEDDDGNAADGNSITDPLQALWDVLEVAGIMAKGKEAVRQWCERVLGRPIPTSADLRETDVPLLIGTAQGKITMPNPAAKAEPAPNPDLAKPLNEALDKLAPWKPGATAADKKAAKLAWINAMVVPRGKTVKALSELPEAELVRLTKAALAGEMPDDDPDPEWMNDDHVQTNQGGK